MSSTKKLKALNPLIREDIFVLDSILDITTRLKRSCSIEDGILLVYLYNCAVIRGPVIGALN